MKKITLLLLVAGMIGGCKKDGTITPEARIKTITHNGTITTYYYDASGRLSRETASGTSGYKSYVYKGSDSIIIYKVDVGDSARYGYYYLNGQGYATSYKTYGINGSITTYFYNGNGNILTRYTVNPFYQTGDTMAYDVSGNITFRKYGFKTNPSSTYSTTTYTYLATESTITNENKGMAFLGKLERDLVSEGTITGWDYSSGNYNSIITYTYEFDGEGRVTKESWDLNPGSDDETTFTYY